MVVYDVLLLLFVLELSGFFICGVGMNIHRAAWQVD